eukprot:11520824-Alexandrium_andersonii.AAC.1
MALRIAALALGAHDDHRAGDRLGSALPGPSEVETDVPEAQAGRPEGVEDLEGEVRVAAPRGIHADRPPEG